MKCCFIYMTVVPSVSTQSWGLTEWAEIPIWAAGFWRILRLHGFWNWHCFPSSSCGQSNIWLCATKAHWSFYYWHVSSTKSFVNFKKEKIYLGSKIIYILGAHLKNLSCAPLWNCCYPVLVLVWMQTFCSLLYAFSLVLKILNTFIPILIFQILLSCNCYK